ncbi:MAG: FeoB small GTPase domain-containing protein, partial [candidate division NC10 bacterium]
MANGGKREGLPGLREPRSRTFALLGRILVGKTTLWDGLALRRKETGYYPGTTVPIACGRTAKESLGGDRLTVIDTPGLISLVSEDEDENIGHRLIQEGWADSLLLVADARNLKRSLAMALAWWEYGLPVVLDLNMMDEARMKGITVDPARLAQELGAAVGATVAVDRMGLPELRSLMFQAKPSTRRLEYPAPIPEFLDTFEKLMPRDLRFARALGLLALGNDRWALRYLEAHCDPGMWRQVAALLRLTRRKFPRPPDVVLMDFFLEQAGRMTGAAVTQTPPPPPP